MRKSIIYSLFFLTLSFNCFSQSKKTVKLYLDQMLRKWEYSEIGDTLLITYGKYGNDSISSAKFTFLDCYGSYVLELKYKDSEVVHNICYKGSKTSYFISTIAIYDSLGNHIGNRKEKLFSPVRVKNCEIQDKQKIKRTHNISIAKSGADGISIISKSLLCIIRA